MKTTCLFIIVILTISCNSSIKQKKADTSLSVTKLYSDSGTYAFTDAGSFWLLYFQDSAVCFDFNPSCGVSFPANIHESKIIFNWSKNMNCNFDRGLNKTFKNVQTPEIGKPFGEFYLVNDSIGVVKYYYQDWVNKINEEEKRTIDTLFPTRFRLIHF